MPTLPAPLGDVLEIDEICIRQSPPFWLWIAVSRLVGHVLGFAIGDRSDAMLKWLWTDVPKDYRDRVAYTDHWGAYERVLAPDRHVGCDKGSGQTSIAEAMNTKWRQRQSGLVRHSCGVSRDIEMDVVERFMILAEGHNKERIHRWQRRQKLTTTTASP